MIRVLLSAMALCAAVSGQVPTFQAPEQMSAEEFPTNHLFNVADLNGDGKKDLIFLNAGHENMFVCWNTGTNASPVFGHAERLWLNLTETVPECLGDVTSFQMLDFDRDNDLDMVTWDWNHAGPQGAGWLKNTGTNLAYEYDSSFHFGITETRQWGDNLKHDFAADWDKDGLLDLIVYDFYRETSVCLTWYRNTGSASAPAFGPRRVFKVAAQPDTFINAPRPYVIDWNNDGRPDIVAGGGHEDFDQGDKKVRVWFGTASLDSLSGPSVVDSVTGGNSFIVHDWNEDGKKDLVIMDTLAFLRIYLNRNTDAAPVFSTTPDTLRGKDFCHSDKWACQLLDWNKDGRTDLLYGGGFNQMCSAVWARVRLYLDQASSGEPALKRGEFLSCNGRDIKDNWGLWGRTMAYADDMDADNDWDLYFAYRYANPISFNYYQGGPSTLTTLDFISEQAITYGAALDTFNTDMHPRICDLDHDGLKDLLIGVDGGDTRKARIWLYKNTGTASSPLFSESSVRLLITSADQANASFDLCKMDGDGLEDIVMASDSGYVFLYRNQGTSSSPQFNARERLQDDAGGDVRNPSYPFHMRPDGSVRPSANVVCAGDFDHDGVPDLLCTISWIRYFTQWSNSNGFYLLRGVRGAGVEGAAGVLSAPALSVSPNPFCAGAAISFSRTPEALKIYDLSGRLVADLSGRVKGGAVRWNAGDLAPGLYVVRAVLNGKTAEKRVMLLR